MRRVTYALATFLFAAAQVYASESSSSSSQLPTAFLVTNTTTSSSPSSTAAGSSNGTSAGGSSNSSMPAGGAAAPSGMGPDEKIALTLIYAFLAALAVAFLASVPRLLGRLTRPSASSFFSGWILRPAHVSETQTDTSSYGYGRSASVKYPPAAAGVGRSVSSSKGGLQRSNTNATLVASSHGHDRGAKWYGDDNETYEQTMSPTVEANYFPYSSKSQSPGGRGSSSSPSGPGVPAHVPSVSSLLYPLSSVFGMSVMPAQSVGKTVLLLLYAVIVVVVVFIQGGAPLADAERLGWIAVAQIPIVVALGAKNGVVGWFTVMGYERLNYLHRWAATVFVVCVNWHGLGYLYKWQLASPPLTATYLKSPANQAGLATLIATDILALASLPFIRTRFYRLFFSVHILGIAAILIAAANHKKGTIPFIVTALVIYGLDQVIRLIKTRVVTAKVRCLPELQSTRVTIPANVLGKGWRAGQHVRIRVLSLELGLFGWLNPHPFTIGSAPASNAEIAEVQGADGRGLELIVKKAGKWTGKLYDAAGRAGYYSSDAYADERSLKVIVEGPYGGLGNMVVSSYASAVLVGGGSGITFPLGVMEDAVASIRSGSSSLRYLELVWTAQDKDAINPLLPTFSSILSMLDSVQDSRTVLKISVYFSRMSKPRNKTSSDEKEYADSAEAYLSALSARGLSVSSGRPNVPKIIESACTFAGNLPPAQAKGVAVASCGPAELVRDVSKAARDVKSELRDACGGVEVHEELFGW